MSYILSDTQRETIKKYIETQPQKIVKKFDYKNKKIEYCDELKGRDIKTLKDEEIVRAYLLTKFVNELGYDISKIEIEHEYKAGRPHTNTSRIDVIVRDKNNDVFLFVELKAPEAFFGETGENRDQIIEDQLFKVAAMARPFHKFLKDNLQLSGVCVWMTDARFISVLLNYSMTGHASATMQCHLVKGIC